MPVLGQDAGGSEGGGSLASDSKSEGDGSARESAVSDGLIDINAATAEELDALPGIGAAKALAIVKEREKNGRFHSVEDLLRVKGIGPKLLEKMKSSIVAKL
ncbi:ComE operon protein 1 [Paenibacillus plantiphilus]|uniref:ComE operon protein 1 n=1 Tax=Paenibacillus plantiphilus TaxID=2905650 RepID=A0ABM9CSN2_9BACL|nr:ComE operon protein 1 [Paenibacillus plantiphilus]